MLILSRFLLYQAKIPPKSRWFFMCTPNFIRGYKYITPNGVFLLCRSKMVEETPLRKYSN